MKQQKAIGFYFNIIAAILAVAALVAYAVMAQDGQSAPASVYVVSLVALVLQVVTLVGASTKGEGQVLDLLNIVTAVLYAVALVLLAQGRMAVVVNVFANHVGTVGTPLIAALGLFAAAILVKMISGFMAMTKNRPETL
ncbi:MAG: hypothetical protein LIO45_08485 [Clostridiales bacterium]|nr:hypothetical protein [Clostridiales bacterium]